MSYAVTAIAQPDVQPSTIPFAQPAGKRTLIRQFDLRDEADEYAARLVTPYWRDVRVEPLAEDA